MANSEKDRSQFDRPISDLGLSEEFTTEALTHGYTSLSKFNSLTLADLMKMDWLNSSMISELFSTLKKEQGTTTS